jgi:hypothetical protein
MDVQRTDTVHIPAPSTTKLTPSSTYPTQYVLYQDFTYARVWIGSAGTCLTTADRLTLPSPTRLTPLLFPTASVTNPTPPPPTGLITYLINLPTVRQQLSVTAITSSCDPIVGGSLVTPLQTALPVVHVTTVFELYAETVTHRMTALEVTSATSLLLPTTSVSGLTAVVTTLRSSSYSPVSSSDSPVSSSYSPVSSSDSPVSSSDSPVSSSDSPVSSSDSPVSSSDSPVSSSDSPVSSPLPPRLSQFIPSASSYSLTASSPTSLSQTSQLDGSVASMTQSRTVSSTKPVSYQSSAVGSTVTLVFDTTIRSTATSRGLHDDYDPANGQGSSTNSRETSRSYVGYTSVTAQPMTSRQTLPSGRPPTLLIGSTDGNLYSNGQVPGQQQEASSTSTSTPRTNTTGSKAQQSATSVILVSSGSLSLYERYSRSVWMLTCLLLSSNI